MRRLTPWFASVGFLIVGGGCAQNAMERRLDERLAREAPLESVADFNLRADQLIQLTPGLSRTQRWELAALHDSTRLKLAALQEKGLKLRSVLIQDLVSPNYNRDQVAAIKRRIVTVENERLEETFKSLDLANSVLGQDSGPHHQRIMTWLLDPTNHPVP